MLYDVTDVGRAGARKLTQLDFVTNNIANASTSGFKSEHLYYAMKGKNAQEGDRIYLDKLLFDAGSSKLKESSKKELDKITILLKRYPKINVEIQGHVCCTPTFHKEAIDSGTRKRELSKNRAERVYKYLLTRGISKTRLTFKGYGNTQPLNKGSEYDRRVELVITKI